MGVPPGNRPAVPRDCTRGVPERYVAGYGTRGRPEGRPYPLSQQAIHETSGLGTKISWYCTFFAIEVISQLTDTSKLWPGVQPGHKISGLGEKFTRWDYYLNLLKKINYNIFWLHLWQYIVPAELTKPQL
jgi:hypothetical protein